MCAFVWAGQRRSVFLSVTVHKVVCHCKSVREWLGVCAHCICVLCFVGVCVFTADCFCLTEFVCDSMCVPDWCECLSVFVLVIIFVCVCIDQCAILNCASICVSVYLSVSDFVCLCMSAFILSFVYVFCLSFVCLV